MVQKSTQVRVRFAPSPTGIPHIGNTRTALFNYLFAKKNNGQFILRIEDTDQKRKTVESEEAIFQILDWLGLKYDQEVTYQSQRLGIYKEHVQMLLDKKAAYKKDGAVWVHVPEKTFQWTDAVGNKEIEFDGEDVEDFVILKSDGFPTYHLANVVDDHLMAITHVIRGEEWISSTPKHLYLYESFNWDHPQFAHLSVILGPDKSKLSKRHGAKSILDYRKDGFVKEALLNFMALLGWNPGEDKEQLSLAQMEKVFELKDVNTANPIFDIRKLEWLNGVWIRTLGGENKLEEKLKEFYQGDKDILNKLKDKNAKILIGAASSRMKTLTNFKNLINIERQRKMTKEEGETAGKLHNFLVKELEGASWENEKFLAALKNFSKDKNVPFKTIYFLLTGKEQGIGLLELNQIYGKELFINNLKA